VEGHKVRRCVGVGEGGGERADLGKATCGSYDAAVWN
jgi:hypothetical protein